VPEEMRNRILRRLLADMRKRYMEEQMLWDQKVLLRAEEHPAFCGGARGTRRLTEIQHELDREKAEGHVRTKRFHSVVSIMENVSNFEAAPEEMHRDISSLEHGATMMSTDAKASLKSKLQKTGTSLSAQRAALEQIRASIPRPFHRSLIPKNIIQAAYDRAVADCTAHSSFEMRPLKSQPGDHHNAHGNSPHHSPGHHSPGHHSPGHHSPGHHSPGRHKPGLLRQGTSSGRQLQLV